MLDTFGRPAATPRVLVCTLLLMVLGACGTPVEGSCENKGGTLRVPNNGRVWTVDYEPTGVEVRLQVTLEGSAGPAQASSQMSLPESWVVFTQPGRGADLTISLSLCPGPTVLPILPGYRKLASARVRLSSIDWRWAVLMLWATPLCRASAMRLPFSERTMPGSGSSLRSCS